MKANIKKGGGQQKRMRTAKMKADIKKGGGQKNEVDSKMRWTAKAKLGSKNEGGQQK